MRPKFRCLRSGKDEFGYASDNGSQIYISRTQLCLTTRVLSNFPLTSLVGSLAFKMSKNELFLWGVGDWIQDLKHRVLPLSYIHTCVCLLSNWECRHVPPHLAKTELLVSLYDAQIYCFFVPILRHDRSVLILQGAQIKRPVILPDLSAFLASHPNSLCCILKIHTCT